MERDVAESYDAHAPANTASNEVSAARDEGACREAHDLCAPLVEAFYKWYVGASGGLWQIAQPFQQAWDYCFADCTSYIVKWRCPLPYSWVLRRKIDDANVFYEANRHLDRDVLQSAIDLASESLVQDEELLMYVASSTPEPADGVRSMSSDKRACPSLEQ